MKGFEFGGNDYIVKPFSLEEIERRISLVLDKKEKDKKTISQQKINDLLIDFEKKTIIKEKIIFNLNEIEVQILKLLLSEKNKIFSRKEILISLLNSITHSDYRIVDFYISKLRYKIENEPKNPVYIETVRGLGYRFLQ